MLEILLLGPPVIRLDGNIVDVSRRQSRAILYYVAAQGRAVSRERLSATFWPDLDQSSARSTLRVALHGLRRMLGDSLRLADDAVSLADDVLVDLRQFETPIADANATRASVESALALYRGDFLEGEHLPDSTEFDAWVTSERERCRRLAIRGLSRQADWLENEGDYSDAISTLDRALAFDALQEDLQRSAMRLHFLAGDRPSAIRRYESFRRMLHEQMGVSPMPETVRLYESIADGSMQPSPKRRPSASPSTDGPARPPGDRGGFPFVGRAVEIASLREWLAGDDAGLVLVEGEPGVGKTRLVQEALIGLKVTVLRGAGRELEKGLPYHPVVEALQSVAGHSSWPMQAASIRAVLGPIWVAEISRLLPDIDPSTTPTRRVRSGDEWRLWEAVRRYLVALAGDGRIALFLDDVHWADQSTLGLLGYLGRQRGAASVKLIAAARPAPPRSPLNVLIGSLTREGHLRRIPLARLEKQEVADLAVRLGGDAGSAALADWLWHCSEGNAYIVSELVRHLRQRGAVSPDGALDPSLLEDGSSVPTTVATLIESRLNGVSDDARRVLDVAVAIGREFDHQLVARAADLSEAAVLDALDELRDASLIEPIDDTRFAFDHALTMEVAYRSTGEARHRLMHRRVAEALQNTSTPRREDRSGLIAWHFAEGNAWEQAVPHALRAARSAAKVAAWQQAADFYQMARRGGSPDALGEALVSYAEALLYAGEPEKASQICQEAMRWARENERRDDEEEAALLYGRILLSRGRYQDAIEVSRDLLTIDSPGPSPSAEYLWGAAISLSGSDLDAATVHLRNAVTLASTAPSVDRSLLSQAHFELGGIAAQQGDLRRAVVYYRHALTIAREADDPESTLLQVVLALNNLAYHLFLIGDLSARENAESGLALARDRGLVNLQPYLLSTLGEIVMRDGDLDQAGKLFAEGLELADRLSMPERVAGLTANLGLLADRLGKRDEAIEKLEAALEKSDSLGTKHLSAQIRIWLAPLLPPADGRAVLDVARAYAEAGKRWFLVRQIEQVEPE